METLTEPTAAPPSGQLVPQTSLEAPFELELAFTDAYRGARDVHPAIREAQCLAVQFPAILQPIRSSDLLAGRVLPALVGFSPDEWGSCAFGYYHLPDAIREALDHLEVDATMRARVDEMLAFWETESTAARVRNAYPNELATALPSDDWMNAPGVAFPLYRITGATVNYERLLERGIRGLRADVESRRETARDAGEPTGFFDGSMIALDVLSSVCRFYAGMALEMISTASTRRAVELTEMAAALEHVAERPPRTFREATQLFWLYALTGDLRNHGRMDVYLGPFLAADLTSGRLEEDEALAILKSLWQLMADRETRVHNRVIVGGRGRPNERESDRFAILAMEASRTVLEAEPQLSLRFYDGMDPALMAQARDVIAEGRTFPILYNDDVNIPAVMAAFDVDEEVATQYVPYGCGEYILEHRSIGTPSGVINLLKALEVTLTNGVDLTTGLPMGLALGRLSDFESFDDLWAAYTRQVEYFVGHLADQQALEYRVAAAQSPFLLLSLLYDDCLERGLGALEGGVRYLGGTLETYGNVNTADSLLAIKELVFEREEISRETLLAAIAADFHGYEYERKLLRDVPKYGNDRQDADEMFLRVHDHVCTTTRAQADRVGLHSYLVVVINNAANSLMGQWTAASADGRGAGLPMNNGNAPSSGNDVAGATAMLNSIVKPRCDIHAGAVQNLKFSHGLMRDYRPMVDALLDTYFDNGGAQAMITVVGREELERALENPDQYRHVFVRVGGFSARFVDLAPNVQLEILNRTLY
jgi:pyruvate-formate lyase